MKKSFLLFALFCVADFVAQDTLVQFSGEKQLVKVEEINSTLIKYRKTENINGPVYSVGKRDIHYIKYAGGHIDSFPNVDVPNVVQSAGPGQVIQSKKNQITYYGSKIVYDNEVIGESKLYSLINSHPDENARKEMNSRFVRMKAHKDIGTTCLVAGLGLGCVTVVLTSPLVTGLYDDFLIPTDEGMQVAAAGILSGAVMRITAFAVSQAQRNKRKAKIREIAAIYNGEYDFK